MNIEIKEKFNNFVKIIENKEKIEWLKQLNVSNDKFQKSINSTEYYNNTNNINNINYINDVNYTNINYTNINTNANIDDCSCQISSGYGSESESKKISEKINNLNNDDLNNDDLNNDIKSKSTKSTNKSIKSVKSAKSTNKSFSSKSSNKNYFKKSSSKFDELSLLEDDYFIGIDKNKFIDNNKFLDDAKNSISNKLTTKTINSEFQNIFLINDDLIKNVKINKNESSEIKNNLENIYNKIIMKNLIQNKSNGYKISEYLDLNLNKLETKKSIDYGIKKISELIEHIYNESTRGWNYEHNLYILQLERLNENFEKVIFSDGQIGPCKNLIKIGYIYRNFNEPLIYLEKDFTKHWVGLEINLNNSNNLNNLNNSNNSQKMIQTKYQIKDKILFYCLKNLTKSNKFKKKISKITYKFIKKTVQIYGKKDLIVDIILFVGIENIE